MSLQALADIVIPRGGILEESASELSLVDELENYLGMMPDGLRARIGLLVRAFDMSPIFARGFRRRFHRLSGDLQEAWIERVRTSKGMQLKLPFIYLEQLIAFVYTSLPSVEKAIGFDYSCRRDNEKHGIEQAP